jgi:hypothetical protein
MNKFLKTIFTLSIFISLSLGLISCKNDLSDKEILELVKNRQNSYGFKKFGKFWGSTGAFQVCKIQKIELNPDINKINILDVRKEYLSFQLSKKNIVKLEVNTKLIKNVKYKFVKTYLTESGKKLLIHENKDFYYLNSFDFDDYTLISRKSKGDTIIAQFKSTKLNKTTIFNLIENSTELEENLKKTQRIEFIKVRDSIQVILNL